MSSVRVFDHEGEIRHPRNETGRRPQFEQRFWNKQRFYLDTTGSEVHLECYLHAETGSYDEHLYLDYRTGQVQNLFSAAGRDAISTLEDGRGWSITSQGKPEQRLVYDLKSVSSGKSYGLDEDIDLLLEKNRTVTAAVREYRVGLSLLAYFADRGITAVIGDEIDKLEDGDVDIRLYRDARANAPVVLTKETRKEIDNVQLTKASSDLVAGIETIKDLRDAETVKRAFNDEVFDKAGLDFEVVDPVAQSTEETTTAETTPSLPAVTITVTLPVLVSLIVGYLAAMYVGLGGITGALGSITSFDVGGILRNWPAFVLVLAGTIIFVLTGIMSFGSFWASDTDERRRAVRGSILGWQTISGFAGGFAFVVSRGPVGLLSVTALPVVVALVTTTTVLGTVAWTRSGPSLSMEGTLKPLSSGISVPDFGGIPLLGSDEESLNLESPTNNAKFEESVRIEGATSSSGVDVTLIPHDQGEQQTIHLMSDDGRFEYSLRLDPGKYTLAVEVEGDQTAREFSVVARSQASEVDSMTGHTSSSSRQLPGESQSTKQDQPSVSGAAQHEPSTDEESIDSSEEEAEGEMAWWDPNN